MLIGGWVWVWRWSRRKKNNSALQAYKQAFALGSLSLDLRMNVQEKIDKLSTWGLVTE